MPRNYYCDFCQCTFPDNLTNRRNHNQGAAHLTNRKLHYDWFQDPDTFIAEQLKKPPCHRFATEGHCSYGLACTYGHFSFNQNTGQPIYPPELTEWFQQRSKKSSTPVISKQQQKIRYRLPAGWRVKDLPPSLKPPPSKHGYHWDQVGSW